MIQELLYTSAPRGLRPGSKGFCTVLSSAGMSAPVASALEALSGYRPVYPPGDPNAALNPVVYSHLLYPLGGKRQSVLSRVAEYGLDYSQRTNKIAHHVAIDFSDRPPAGPAWLLQEPGIMRTEWDGELKVVSTERAVPQGTTQLSICSAWKDITGDAGWAGVLAESFLKDPDRQAYLLFEPGMDLLPLIAEAISLLPEERRWEVTFSTYFTKLPKGATCNWRCVLADSPEANESRRHVQALRINVCEPLGTASGGDLVEAARTGRTPVPTEAVRERTVVAVPPPITAAAEDGPIRLRPAAAGIPPAPPRPSFNAGPTRRRRKSRSIGPALWGMTLLVMTAAGIGVYVVTHRPNESTEKAIAQAGSKEASAPAAEPVGDSSPPEPDEPASNTHTTPETDGKFHAGSGNLKSDNPLRGGGASVGDQQTANDSSQTQNQNSGSQTAEGATSPASSEGSVAETTRPPAKQTTADGEPPTTQPGTIIYWEPSDKDLKGGATSTVPNLMLARSKEYTVEFLIPKGANVASGDQMKPEDGNTNPRAELRVKSELDGTETIQLRASLVVEDGYEHFTLRTSTGDKPVSRPTIRGVALLIEANAGEQWWIVPFSRPKLAEPPDIGVEFSLPREHLTGIRVAEIVLEVAGVQMRFIRDLGSSKEQGPGRFTSNFEDLCVFLETLGVSQTIDENAAKPVEVVCERLQGNGEGALLSCKLTARELIDRIVKTVSGKKNRPLQIYAKWRNDHSNAVEQGLLAVGEELVRQGDRGAERISAAIGNVKSYAMRLQEESDKLGNASNSQAMKATIDEHKADANKIVKHLTAILAAATTIGRVTAALENAKISRIKIVRTAYRSERDEEGVDVPIFVYPGASETRETNEASDQ